MKPIELLEVIGDARESYIYDAGECRKKSELKGKGNRRRLLLLAAIIAVSILLMGSAVIIRLTLASAPEYPLVDPTEVAPEHIHLSVSDVTPTSMRVFCRIDGVVNGVNDIFIQTNGAFTIEKRVDEEWVQMEVKTEDPAWDPDNVRTKGSTDWHIDWTAPYGVLPAGIYRFTTTVLQGNVPVSVEFAVPETEAKELSVLVNEILDREYYHIRYTRTMEFGSTKNLSKSEKKLIESDYADVVWTDEYWKLGEDILYLSSRNEQIWTGMMLKNGVKYQLDHEGNDRTNPVSGWSPWPDGDMFWLTLWTSLADADRSTLKETYGEDGRLARVTRSVYSPKFDDQYDVEVTHKEEWIFFDDDPQVITAKFNEQNTETALSFSWAEDVEEMKSLDVVYKNTFSEPVATVAEVIERAMAECTVEYDKILVYRDAAAKMWKVEFQIEYGYQGYQYIYLNDDGITQMVSGLGSKVPEWKDLYPDP